MVAFLGGRDSGGGGIYTAAGGTFTLLADSTSPVLDGIDNPSINSAGTVAFLALRDSAAGGGSGVYTADANGVVTVADSTSPLFSAFGSAAINDAGAVAFRANRDAAAGGGQGIYAAEGGTIRLVVQTGDALDGSTVTQLDLGLQGLNAGGQMAFWAKLADGRQGIYTATPTPEPATVGLIAAAGLGAGWGFRRLRRRAAG